MEGLHHDTNLEPISAAPNDKPTEQEAAQPESISPDTSIPAQEDNIAEDSFASASVNQNLTPEAKIELKLFHFNADSSSQGLSFKPKEGC